METGNPPGERRRISRFWGQKLVKLRFQFTYAVTIFVLLGASTFIIWLFGTLAINHMVDNRIIGQLSVFSLALVFGLSLIFSHFIAGPIYRFEKTLETVRDGDLTVVVRLRARDEFKELADLFNQMLASLRLRLQTERDVVDAALEKAGKLVDVLRQAGHAAEAGELERVIAAARDLPVRLKLR
ncbi:MAG: hypothetical protein DMG07_26115 [Acidobacteria bacterium]|nr:MAG: hypothetical protein DMG07_26115 [Acidobacteriota bacterium]